MGVFNPWEIRVMPVRPTAGPSFCRWLGLQEQCEHQESSGSPGPPAGGPLAAGQAPPVPRGGGHNEEPKQPALRSTAREALCAPGGQDPLQGGNQGQEAQEG